MSECDKCGENSLRCKCHIKNPNATSENYKDFHYCEVPCKQHLYGAAIDQCYEDQDGYLFVCNGEYGSQVNYCPLCGYKAKKNL